MDSPPLRVGLVGTYPRSTRHLAQLLADHPRVELTYLAAPPAVCKQPIFSDLQPVKLAEPTALAALLPTLPDCAVLFLDLPLGWAARWVPSISARYRIVDLSADYRFSSLSVYQQSYQIERQDVAMAVNTVYGLPEWFDASLEAARLVGCPSSVATAGLLDRKSVV